jgi:hypothetical protein
MTARTAPVEVRTPVADCNNFMNLREEEAAAHAQIESLKPRIMALVAKGKQKGSIEGSRENKSGKFIITLIGRDMRVPDEEKTLALLREKIEDHPQFRDVIVDKPSIDRDRFAEMIEQGIVTNADLRKILRGANTVYPQVRFKPGQ